MRLLRRAVRALSLDPCMFGMHARLGTLAAISAKADGQHGYECVRCASWVRLKGLDGGLQVGRRPEITPQMLRDCEIGIQAIDDQRRRIESEILAKKEQARRAAVATDFVSRQRAKGRKTGGT